ncbi:hypothetical protein [Aeromonas veronii]
MTAIKKEKALSWAPKELSNQKNYIGCVIKALGEMALCDGEWIC